MRLILVFFFCTPKSVFITQIFSQVCMDLTCLVVVFGFNEQTLGRHLEATQGSRTGVGFDTFFSSQI
jgi:hypothetical protein